MVLYDAILLLPMVIEECARIGEKVKLSYTKIGHDQICYIQNNDSDSTHLLSINIGL